MSAARIVEQFTLPGQAAASEGPVDMAGMFLMHHGFRRDLDNFVRIVPLAELGDRARWRRLARRWRNFSVVLHKHHTGEDAGLWPLLLDRVDAAGDTTARSTLEAMEAEHADIDPLLQSCGMGFDRMAATPTPMCERPWRSGWWRHGRTLGEHLAHEEVDALSLVQRYLSQRDWETIGTRPLRRRVFGGRVVEGVVLGVGRVAGARPGRPFSGSQEWECCGCPGAGSCAVFDPLGTSGVRLTRDQNRGSDLNPNCRSESEAPALLVRIQSMADSIRDQNL